MTTAIDAALADLEALEQEIEAPAKKPAAEVQSDVEVIEVAPDASIEQAEDALSELESLLGDDELGADVKPAYEASAVDDLDELEALLGSDVDEPAAPVTEATVEEIAKELALEDAREELYSESEVEPEGATDLVKPEEVAAVEKAPKMKARAHGSSKPSDALVARLGSVKAVESHLRISTEDDTLSADELNRVMKERMSEIDALPKKVGEKAVNLIAHLAGGASLSCYTQIALDMLLANGRLTSKELVERYMARPYSEGTSRSQCGQIMQLLPAMGIAERINTGTLELVKDSPVAAALSSAMGKAAA